MIRFTRQELADLHLAAMLAFKGVDPKRCVTKARAERLGKLLRRLAELREIKRGKARRAKERRNG